MFLRFTTRKKNGKEHRYYSLVENRRVSSGRVVQRPVLYLGEINDSQKEAWRKTIEIFEEGKTSLADCRLIPRGPDRSGGRRGHRAHSSQPTIVASAAPMGSLLAGQPNLGAVGVGPVLGRAVAAQSQRHALGLGAADPGLLPLDRTGSEWRLYRHWFEHSALADLLGVDLELADIHKLYECHDRLLTHKQELFNHLTGRWKDLFNARFEVLLYDLTSTYFESDPPFPEGDKRRYGYSRTSARIACRWSSH